MTEKREFCVKCPHCGETMRADLAMPEGDTVPGMTFLRCPLRLFTDKDDLDARKGCERLFGVMTTLKQAAHKCELGEWMVGDD